MGCKAFWWKVKRGKSSENCLEKLLRRSTKDVRDIEKLLVHQNNIIVTYIVVEQNWSSQKCHQRTNWIVVHVCFFLLSHWSIHWFSLISVVTENLFLLTFRFLFEIFAKLSNIAKKKSFLMKNTQLKLCLFLNERFHISIFRLFSLFSKWFLVSTTARIQQLKDRNPFCWKAFMLRKSHKISFETFFMIYDNSCTFHCHVQSVEFLIFSLSTDVQFVFTSP